ncbi:MAG: hypothetical protein AAF206_15745, partial [Bacteroidota bacterium]
DSLKTHPDCSARIAKIAEMLSTWPESEKGSRTKFAQNDLSDFAEILDVEELYGRFIDGDRGKVIYHALKLRQQYPRNAFIKGMIAVSIQELLHFKKNHRLSVILGRNKPGRLQNEDLSLHFFNSLRLKHYRELAAAIDLFWTNEDESEFFLFASILAAHNTDNEALTDKRIKAYKQKFPEGLFLKNIDKL